MATFRKRADKWQARVQRSGQSSLAKSFNTKADAVKWARHTESQLDLGTLATKEAMPPLMRIVARYLAEVTPTKKGSKQEAKPRPSNRQNFSGVNTARQDHKRGGF